MSEPIFESAFTLGLYQNENKIAPGFVGTVMEIDVTNVVSISNSFSWNLSHVQND